MSEEHVLTGAASTSIGFRARPIGLKDLSEVLRKGLEDFNARPTHAIFATLLYPVIGVGIYWVGADRNLLPLAFPVLSGFALLGPFMAIGLYEMSRRRERGETVRFRDAFNVFRYHAFGSLLGLGVVLACLFFAWLSVALSLYEATLGFPPPPTLSEFGRDILTTAEGWTLIIVGNGVGFLFALAALAISVVSFPLVIDRHVSVGTAILTSVDVVVRNPGTIAVWGLIVAVALLLGALPFMAGLVVVFPVLGHATWHLYRRAVGS